MWGLIFEHGLHEYCKRWHRKERCAVPVRILSNFRWRPKRETGQGVTIAKVTGVWYTTPAFVRRITLGSTTAGRQDRRGANDGEGSGQCDVRFATPQTLTPVRHALTVDKCCPEYSIVTG